MAFLCPRRLDVKGLAPVSQALQPSRATARAGAAARRAGDAVGAPRAAAPGHDNRVAVIGAGIVGACAGVYLQRAGHAVTLFDPGGPAAGASNGNAGLISPDSCVPTAMPGLWRKVPGWLARKNGPLAIDARHAVESMPWLYRFLRSGTASEALRIAQALKALHAPAFEIYRDLLGPTVFQDLFRTTGTVQIWDEGGADLASPLVRRIWEENGVVAEPLSADELRQLVPDLTPAIGAGLFFPNNGMTVNPARLVETMCGLFSAAGGTLARERVAKIIPEGAHDFRLVSNRDDRRFAKVVVASGAWSRDLLTPLGIAPLLDTERGYHATLADPGIDLRLPVLHRGLGIGATPMEHGLRLAGTVEFAGLRKPMDERRVAALLKHAKALFPKLRTESFSMWMGFRPSMPDSLPVIDAAARFPGLFLAFGHGHFGMTGGPATGRALAALVAGEPQSLDLAPYAASRF